MIHSKKNNKKTISLSIALCAGLIHSPLASAHDWIRYFSFNNGKEAEIHYSLEEDGAALQVEFDGDRGPGSTRIVYADHGRFQVLGQRDSRNPTQKSSLNHDFRIPSWVNGTQNFFWIRNLSDNDAVYIFEDGTVAHSCAKEWSAASARLIDYQGQKMLVESVKKGEGGTLYLSRTLAGENCIALSQSYLPQLHEDSRIEISEGGVLKIGGMDTQIDLASRCLLYPLKGRPDFAIKTCADASPAIGSFLVRLNDQKQYKLHDKVWTPIQINAVTNTANGIFELKSPQKYRIDLDQFDAELKRFSYRSDGDSVLDDKGRPVDALAQIHSKYTDLVADSIAHPERYQENSDASVNQYFLESFWARRSVVLLGKPGTGKSSAVRAFARDVGRGLIRGVPRTTEIYDVKISSLLSGTTYVGQTEQRIAELLSAAQQSGCIFFLDEFHTLAGAGTSSHNSNDITQYFKKGLEAGELLLIGTDTDHEFYNAFGHDPAFIERFDIKKVSPPDGAQLLEIIHAKVKSEFNIDLAPAIIQLAIDLSQNYDVTAAQPRSAVNLLKKAVARLSAANAGASEITEQTLKEAAVIKYGFDPFQLNPANLRARLTQLKTGLDAELIGQEDAKQLVYSLWARKITGVGDDRQVNSLLLAGPPGVGKTRIAELSADLMGYKKTVIEMNKFAHTGIEAFRREVYQALLEHPFRVIILDEIEKSHSSVQAAALSMLQTGAFRVTEEMPYGKSVVREVSAKHALFILTSNAAGHYIQLQLKRHGSVEEADLKNNLAEDGILEAILSRIQHVGPMTTPTQEEFKKGLTRVLNATLTRESIRHGYRFVMDNEDEFIGEVMKMYHDNVDYRDIRKHISAVEDLIADSLIAQSASPGSEIRLRSTPNPKKRIRREAPAHLSYYQ